MQKCRTKVTEDIRHKRNAGQKRQKMSGIREMPDKGDRRYQV